MSPRVRLEWRCVRHLVLDDTSTRHLETRLLLDDFSRVWLWVDAFLALPQKKGLIIFCVTAFRKLIKPRSQKTEPSASPPISGHIAHARHTDTRVTRHRLTRLSSRIFSQHIVSRLRECTLLRARLRSRRQVVADVVHGEAVED